MTTSGTESAAARPTVVVVGSANTDLVTYLDRVPEGGQTVLGQRFVTGFGGKGANQAVMARRLDVAVRFVGCVGDDDFGDRTLVHLREQGVGVADLERRPGSSGVAPIWVEPDGTNRIVVVPGANGLVTPEQVTAAVGRLNRVDVVVGQLEIPQPATVAALEAGRQHGAVTVLNPAPAIALHAGMLAATDWLVPNEDELDAIGRSVSRPPDPADDGELVALAEVLGVQLVITLGAAGVVVVGRDAPVARITADAVSARDTTGAGDAFVGAFAAALALGRDAVAAATWASRCATASVQRDGAQSSYPSAAQVAELAELVG